MEFIALFLILGSLAVALVGIAELFKMGYRNQATIAIVMLFVFPPVTTVVGLSAFFRLPKPGSPAYQEASREKRDRADAKFPALARVIHDGGGALTAGTREQRTEQLIVENPELSWKEAWGLAETRSRKRPTSRPSS
jgi:hypothetical protein